MLQQVAPEPLIEPVEGKKPAEYREFLPLIAIEDPGGRPSKGPINDLWTGWRKYAANNPSLGESKCCVEAD
jgi:hypothetical protein